MTKKFFSILNINITCAESDEPVENVPCGPCTLCCEKLTPYLTVEEYKTGKYPISLVEPNADDLKINPNVGPTITLFKNPNGGCGMFKDGKCSIYEYRPLACRQFDCRKGHHPSIPNMVEREYKL